MADAEQQDKTSSQGNDALTGLKTEIDQKLASVADQIKQLNDNFANGFSQVVAAVKPKQKVEVEDDDVYDPKRLQDKILSKSTEIASQMLAKERSLNSKIYELTQSYPEITSDEKLKAAMMNNHKNLPQSLQGTPEGYEMAALRTVSEAGLIAKSKRPQVDPDISAGGGSGSGDRSTGTKKAKVTDNMLAFAELLGRPVDDPEYIKRLEKTAQRKNWMKYE